MTFERDCPTPAVLATLSLRLSRFVSADLMPMSDVTQKARKRVRILGVTQGVGFRPFVWRLAGQFGLSGWVQNDSSGLLFEVQGPLDAIDGFLAALRDAPPPLARIDSMDAIAVSADESSVEFIIRHSEEQQGESTPVTQDISICADCLREMTSPADRRYRYPFINCTNCGPRFTIVENAPYDRSTTTMKAFKMCQRCQAEYDDPTNRRFHAQPNACPQCGPCVWFVSGQRVADTLAEPNAFAVQGPEAIRSFENAVREGRIVGAKGVGGFHLLCNATNTNAIALLRQRKGRVDKPLAVMAASIEQVREFAIVEEVEAQILEAKERPIVLLRKKGSPSNAPMLDSVAPGNEFVGVMLPYSPLHYLMVESVSPLVVTSGNIADEPIVRTNEEASTRLAGLADCFLLHNRDINAVCDDSVVRCIDGRLLPVRRSRGYAPMPIRLANSGPSVLAVGGEIKATFCVTKQNYAYMSQHIGDVGNPETLDALQRNVDHFLALFRIELEAIVGDSHPEYLSSQWAQQLAAGLGIRYMSVQHHFAHAASLIAEQSLEIGHSIIACCFDGTGYGTDGAIWGGEFLLASKHRFQRFAHISYFPLPGGDASIKRPYRIAMALLQHYGLEWDRRLPSVSACPSTERRLLWKQLERELNCAATSSMGRLFDAVASLIGIRQVVSYEAQAALELEAAASKVITDVSPEAYSFDLEPFGADSIQVGCSSLLQSICDDLVGDVDPSVMAAQFHHAVARMILAISEKARGKTGLNTVGLTGGVFQNVLLLKLAEQRLRAAGFDVLTHSVVPPNDGGLALGQAVVARNALLDGD